MSLTICQDCGQVHDNLHINWSQATEHSRKPIGDLWCFGCRKRLPHDLVVYADPPGSYYDPFAVRECSRCHKDRTDFPGTIW